MDFLHVMNQLHLYMQHMHGRKQLLLWKLNCLTPATTKLYLNGCYNWVLKSWITLLDSRHDRQQLCLLQALPKVWISTLKSWIRFFYFSTVEILLRNWWSCFTEYQQPLGGHMVTTIKKELRLKMLPLFATPTAVSNRSIRSSPWRQT